MIAESIPDRLGQTDLSGRNRDGSFPQSPPRTTVTSTIPVNQNPTSPHTTPQNIGQALELPSRRKITWVAVGGCGASSIRYEPMAIG